MVECFRRIPTLEAKTTPITLPLSAGDLFATNLVDLIKLPQTVDRCH